MVRRTRFHTFRPTQEQRQTKCLDGLSKFDQAVADSSIAWAPTIPIHLKDNGFQFQFRVCPQFSHKPGFPTPELQDPAASDISNPRSLHIASIAPSHSLAINAFPALRPSYLLLTNSPTKRQTSPLDLSDIQAAWSALNRLDGGNDGEKYMLIFNGGQNAGCSRLHKHMQLFPIPSEFVLFPDRSPEEVERVPYVYDLVRFNRSSSISNHTSNVFKAYLTGLQHAREVLGIREGEHVPHNVVMVREWILVIPRRKASAGGLGANAAGMMGMVWIGSKDELTEWKRRGGASLLREMGVPIENDRKE